MNRSKWSRRGAGAAVWFTALAACLPCAGCATSEPPPPLEAFLGGDLQGMRSFCEQQLREGNQNSRALYQSLLGSVSLLMGDVDAAFKAFRSAGTFMGNWNVSGSEELAAIVGSESSKAYRGDPYERAMNGYYLGLLYWMRGEPDNARAAFKKAILADGESEGERYRVDFTLLFWLAGRASLLMGLASDAEAFFAEARAAQQFAAEHGARVDPDAHVLRDPGSGNVVFLVDVGLGPEKRNAPRDPEIAVFQPRFRPEHHAELYLGDQSLGRSESLADIYYQSMTRGGTAMEGIRKGKAVLKTVTGTAGAILVIEGAQGYGHTANTQLAVGLGLLALSLLTSSHADTRHWTILPDSVQVLTAELPPGTHQLRVVFQDAGGAELPHLTQTWTVAVPAAGEAVYYFRSIPGLDHVRQVDPKPQEKS